MIKTSDNVSNLFYKVYNHGLIFNLGKKKQADFFWFFFDHLWSDQKVFELLGHKDMLAQAKQSPLSEE